MNVLLILLLLSAVGVIAWLISLVLKGRKQIKKYAGIVSVEEEIKRLKKDGIDLGKENGRLKRHQASLEDTIANLKSTISVLSDEAQIQEAGIYEPKYSFGNSERYKAELLTIRDRQKRMVRNRSAVILGTQWTVQGSSSKGKTMMKRLTNLTLRAFNGECDSTIANVKYNNVGKIKDRIFKVYAAINKLNDSQDCRINPDYLSLKIEELHLVHEYQEKKQAELEEQREIRQQMREEAKARKEIERAQREAEKETGRYEKALERARQEIEQTVGEQRERLEAKIALLNQKLQEASEKRARAISRAQMTRSGHVYVVSNIGSFGENTFKIGMTRRLEPFDRVRS